MSKYDVRILILRLDELVEQLRRTIQTASHTLKEASYSQRCAQERKEQAWHRANILANQAKEDGEDVENAGREVASWLSKCLEAKDISEETLNDVIGIQQRANATLRKWQQELSKALAWLQRAEARLERAIQEYERAKGEYENAQRNLEMARRDLERAKADLQRCLRDEERSNCNAEREEEKRAMKNDRAAQERLQIISEQLQYAETEVRLAKEDVARATARVKCCEKAVAYAQQAVTTAKEAGVRAQTAVNWAQRSLEQAQAAERFVLKAKDKAVEEQELTEQVVKQVRKVGTLTDEAQTHYQKADSATGSAHRLAMLACQELEYRVGQLRAFNSRASFLEKVEGAANTTSAVGSLISANPPVEVSSGQPLSAKESNKSAIAKNQQKTSGSPDPELNKRATGAGYADPDKEAEASYEQIRGMSDDVPQISANLDIPENIVSAVRDHVFTEEHDIAVGPGQVRCQRFAADPEIAELWISAVRGTLSGDDLYIFQRILAHEYVEQALMKRGLPFRSSHPEAWKKGYNKATPKHYGAHDLAPLCDIMRDPFDHWKWLGLAATQLPTGDLDLSKLEGLVKIIEALIL